MWAPLNLFSVSHDHVDSKVSLYLFFFSWSEKYLHIICYFYVSNSVYNLNIFPDSTACECLKFFLPLLIFRLNLPISLWQIIFIQFPETLKKNGNLWYPSREKWASLNAFGVPWWLIKSQKKKSCFIKTSTITKEVLYKNSIKPSLKLISQYIYLIGAIFEII